MSFVPEFDQHWTQSIRLASINTSVGEYTPTEEEPSPTPTNTPTEEEPSPTPTNTPTEEGIRSIGESVTYGGLEIVATDTVTVDEFTNVYSDGSEGDTKTPESGAVFLFVNIHVQNIGETEISFPERGGDIELVYKGQGASDEFTGVDMRANSTLYPNYSRTLEDEGADTGAYPDSTVEGWVIFELPEEFERSDAIVTIRYSDISVADSRTFRWRLE
jgi:hypothetical protein